MKFKEWNEITELVGIAALLHGNPGNRRVLESENKWEDNYNDLLMPGVEKAAE